MIRLRAFGTAIAASLLSPLPLLATLQPQDRSLADLEDHIVRAELAQFGSYQELRMELVEVDLHNVPLRSSTPFQLEFADDAVRVRIEAYAFDHAPWVKKSHGSYTLDGAPILGWTIGEEHSRLGRVEVVVDGAVVELPANTFTDVFDAPLYRNDALFAAVLRSRDGWRTYVHLQAGEGPQARLVTWVIDDGEFLCRVVDALE